MATTQSGRDRYSARSQGSTANGVTDETTDSRFTFAALIRGNGKLLGEARYRARTDKRIRDVLAQVDARRAETGGTA